MPYVLHVATGRLPHLNIFGDDYLTQDGTGVRDYIHVMDLAEGHLATIDYLKNQDKGLCIFNLGTGRGYSVFEMMAAFEAGIGQRIPYEIRPRRAGDIAVCYAKVDKAITLLDWQAKRTIDDVVSSTWSWHKRLGAEIIP